MKTLFLIGLIAMLFVLQVWMSVLSILAFLQGRWMDGFLSLVPIPLAGLVIFYFYAHFRRKGR